MKRLSKYYQLSAVHYYFKHNNDIRKTCKIFN